jgi:3',5'-cyclic AMP phosphodiesterase CpdA
VKFDAITSVMRSRVPYCPVRGNHDVGKNHYYEARVTQCFQAGNKLFYSFEQRGVHFVAIDTEQALDPESVQYRWLKADLAAARDAGRFIIPFFHKAIVSVGPHSVELDVQSLRPILHSLFRQNGITLVFQGHDHQYYHTQLDGITYIVSAGGGAPLYDWRVRPGTSDVFEKVYHFCIVDVAPTRIAVTAYRQDLSRVDSFKLPIVPPLPP